MFKYEVKGVIYEGSRNSGEVKSRLESLVGKRFYVKFFNKNPKIYELLYEPVPSEIKRVPENGWSKIPPANRRI